MLPVLALIAWKGNHVQKVNNVLILSLFISVGMIFAMIEKYDLWKSIT